MAKEGSHMKDKHQPSIFEPNGGEFGIAGEHEILEVDFIPFPKGSVPDNAQLAIGKRVSAKGPIGIAESEGGKFLIANRFVSVTAPLGDRPDDESSDHNNDGDIDADPGKKGYTRMALGNKRAVAKISSQEFEEAHQGTLHPNKLKLVNWTEE